MENEPANPLDQLQRFIERGTPKTPTYRWALGLLLLAAYVWIGIGTGRYLYAKNITTAYEPVPTTNRDLVIGGSVVAGICWPIYWPGRWVIDFYSWSTDWRPT